jgi:hypothetical protein
LLLTETYMKQFLITAVSFMSLNASFADTSESAKSVAQNTHLMSKECVKPSCCEAKGEPESEVLLPKAEGSLTAPKKPVFSDRIYRNPRI